MIRLPGKIARTGPRRCRRGIHSLRAKLTIVNVCLLALGIVAATAVSLMGMRHYLLERVDAELLMSRNALGRSGFTQKEIDSLSAIGALREQFMPDASGAGSLPRSSTVLVALDADHRPIAFAQVPPTGRQLELADAVDDPEALAASAEADDVSLGSDPYRVVGTTLADGSMVLMATDTGAVHSGMKKALKLDLALGTILLTFLAVATMLGTRHRLRPLEDMVETASAIAEGDLTRRVPAGHDPVTEIEQLRVALNSMLHQVESAFETRENSAAQLRRFVADASHELRTPLSAIRGYLQLYDKGMLREPAERTRALARMTAEADRMGRLVEELLTLARLDQHPQLRLCAVDLSRLVRDAADDLRAQQPHRPVAVRAEGAMVVQGDESGLRQVVGNLLANIRAHTPADAPVRVELAREENGDGPAGGQVRLRVADEGPGMDREDADRIFDRFFRASSGASSGAHSAQPVGSGLGMAIVQAVVASHGGAVTVQTAPGEGLAVTVALPAAARTLTP
ncbi:sensor histidine kinase [Streptomyces lunaelactis]|uniref:histidine kinase n=1 Tax=Streptomyces lunaelactis TaxID=1535768 RepID=A0A2R4T708_9ACTN|nr:HAMP domain-containing sensor histidine kinase [Streptomyces lunaelactis]AVZ74886.1 sensor histidine kinase [Streptomyces lunaelactis]NUK89944.1 HAMP domain-containing histidine kinase [Streptomyces lunaelactis]NUL06109.1 HAMP domain-containing histidine kinase [Streptomyces lunaelactis]